MKNVKKIELINPPKDNKLDIDDMSIFFGKESCGSYDNSSCISSKLTTCIMYSEIPCLGTEVGDVKCGTYITDIV